MLNKIEYNAALIEKYLRSELTEKEQAELDQWINASEDNKRKFEEWTDTSQLLQKLAALDRVESRKQEAWQKAEVQINRRARLVSFNWWKYVAAAVLVLVAGYWLLVNQRATNDKQQATNIQQPTNDVKPPEINRALITLANGQTVYLDSTSNGQLAMEGNVKLVKLSDGKIVYEAQKASPVGRGLEGAYNTLTNPRGSKVIDITLADGSRVWLNAESSLKYPVSFVGNERMVEITGEAYFEVAKSITASGAKQSFIVQKGDMQVAVLGTHFNVNAYDDEADIKVTLLDGSVRVEHNNSSVIIKPGEQAVTGPHSPLTINYSPDLEQVMAWKNGTFYFSGESLEAIMKQLARWFDLEVEYEGNVPGKRFGGMISRNKNLSEVLRVLELNDVHFRIEGKKIIVIK